MLGIHYGGVLCKDATAAVALKPVLLIERLSVVDNASGMAASAWLKTRAVGASSDVGPYLAGTNTRRVRRALKAAFAGEVGKDVVSRTWRKVNGDWNAWNARSLTDEPIIRLILDGTVVRVRLDKKATSISLLVALGVRADGQKVLLAIKNMGGESEAAWRALLDDLVKRGLKTPELVIVDGAPGLEKALAALWSDVPVQRCTVHKHRNLLAHAPEGCTKSERLEVCELIAHSPLSVNFGMNAFIGCAHETRAIAPLSDVIAASRARPTGAVRVDAIENAATSVPGRRLIPPKLLEARGERQSNAKRTGDSIWRIRLYRTACRPRASR